MKVIGLKLTNGESINIQHNEDMTNDQICTQLLQGEHDYVMVGNAALSKRHILYVTITETQENAPEGAEAGQPTEVTAAETPIEIEADGGRKEESGINSSENGN